RLHNLYSGFTHYRNYRAKKELIYRQVSQKDARQKSVHLTQKAQDLVAECRSYFQLQEKELEERFSEDEIAIFEKILDYYVKKK
uniref:MarR family winged helix-turn-helix transcriptional regulator n=1 Tax=uncultured Streptococcus sp. TaxID=83427 RepID=UPI00345DAFA6